ncbi:nucleotidyltransferase family protein [Microvirga sp. P5_D2]
MREIDLVYRTMFAELGQRCMDAQFVRDFRIEKVDGTFSVEGAFFKMRVKERDYWYHKGSTADGRKQIYVGPVADSEITQRVQEFERIKDDQKARRKLVSTLVREAGLPAPDRFTGDVVDALAAAGMFRLRGVLVGTVAFQCYAGLLGVRLGGSALQTGDADFAQSHAISAAVADTLPPMLDILRKLDPTFREIPSQTDARRSFAFENKDRYRIEFLTPNMGSADHDGKPAPMPALGGAYAQPLRFLDFLLTDPVRSVMLHRSGIAVTVPAPERYAVHKLIVASRRQADGNGILKRDKDVKQAEILMDALIKTRRHSELAEAYAEAWKRGPSWKEGIAKGMGFMSGKLLAPIVDGLAIGLTEIEEEPEKYGVGASAAKRRF